MDPTTLLMAVAALVGLYMAWNIGANDVANAMGTSVGSGALTLKRAILVAAVFEFSGSLLVGGTVTKTIRKGIVDVHMFDDAPLALALGMSGALLAAAIWLNVSSWKGWPVSTTHSIVGAVTGFGIAAGGTSAVNWVVMGKVVASWFVSPVVGGLIGFLVFRLIHARILTVERPLLALRGWAPFLVFPVFAVLTLAMLFKGLKPLKLDFSFGKALGFAVAVGALGAAASMPMMRQVSARAAGADAGEQIRRAERVFLALQVLTACFVAFAHGSNDVANAVGPMSAAFGALHEGVKEKVEVPLSLLLVGGVGIVVGLATYGYKVMATIGREITELTPSRGFSAEFAAACTIVLASKLGMPVSTTHTLVGSVVGVGLARSMGALNFGVLRGIVASWFITVPFAALLSALFFLLGRALLL